MTFTARMTPMQTLKPGDTITLTPPDGGAPTQHILKELRGFAKRQLFVQSNYEYFDIDVLLAAGWTVEASEDVTGETRYEPSPDREKRILLRLIAFSVFLIAATTVVNTVVYLVSTPF